MKDHLDSSPSSMARTRYGNRMIRKTPNMFSVSQCQTFVFKNSWINYGEWSHSILSYHQMTTHSCGFARRYLISGFHSIHPNISSIPLIGEKVSSLKSMRGIQLKYCDWLVSLSATSNDCQDFWSLARFNLTGLPIMTLHSTSMSSVACFLLSIRGAAPTIRHILRERYLAFLYLRSYNSAETGILAIVARSLASCDHVW